MIHKDLYYLVRNLYINTNIFINTYKLDGIINISLVPEFWKHQLIIFSLSACILPTVQNLYVLSSITLISFHIRYFSVCYVDQAYISAHSLD